MDHARVYKSDEGVVVVLPRSVTIAEGFVTVRQEGDSIVLQLPPHNWDWLDDLSGGVDEDFIRHALDRPGWSSKRTD